MTEPSYYDKVVFNLSILSNQASGNPGMTDQELEALIAANLTGPLADYAIVWGPHIVHDPLNGKAINTMYVAQEKNTGNYFVLIAGTNPYSLFDWLWEDGFVSYQIPWVYAPLSGGKIAVGTTTGLVILQNMQPDSGVPGSGTTLWDFLKGLTGSPIHVTVSGHSLGGALSATVALWLQDTQLFWDPDSNATVNTMPTAGPTAGNGQFAAHSNAQLPNAALPSNSPASFRYANSIDLVPHAWNEATLEAAKTLYAPQIPENALVDKAIDLAQYLARNGDYTQLTPADPPFVGTVDESIINPADPTFVNYLMQAAHQHVNAYDDYFSLGLDTAIPRPEKLLISPKLQTLLQDSNLELGDAFEVSETSLSQTLEALALGGKQSADDASRTDALIAELKKFGGGS